MAIIEWTGFAINVCEVGIHTIFLEILKEADDLRLILDF